ncbi:hypothetical protein [Aureimonas endophytica]|uniref:hypothetical protein n=1 Tax=Aureimonas endophytica TaxID=2027858 RepID=UPI00166CD398|nr:hypothetical protein [Aureimonas endophytica]
MRLELQLLIRISDAGDLALPVFEPKDRKTMNNIIYLIGLIVVVLAVLSFFGLR